MNEHTCPEGIDVEVEHEYYISNSRDFDADDPIGAKYWTGAGFSVAAKCVNCGRYLGTKTFEAFADNFGLRVEERTR